jgi:hypothetical protein
MRAHDARVRDPEHPYAADSVAEHDAVPRNITSGRAGGEIL